MEFDFGTANTGRAAGNTDHRPARLITCDRDTCSDCKPIDIQIKWAAVLSVKRVNSQSWQKEVITIYKNIFTDIRRYLIFQLPCILMKASPIVSWTPVPGTRSTADLGNPTSTTCILEETLVLTVSSLHLWLILKWCWLKQCLTLTNCTSLCQWPHSPSPRSPGLEQFWVSVEQKQCPVFCLKKEKGNLMKMLKPWKDHVMSTKSPLMNIFCLFFLF